MGFRTIDAFEDGYFGAAAHSPEPLPQQLNLDGFEARFHRVVTVAIPCSTRRYPEAMLAQKLL
ncbi:hypothetical protein, partial [Epibacterium ulvae]|uniref:hypothetical protein n=1 Tax=Epibacterium ulvae TaxID=1156985 RepID=UPI001E411167